MLAKVLVLKHQCILDDAKSGTVKSSWCMLFIGAILSWLAYAYSTIPKVVLNTL